MTADDGRADPDDPLIRPADPNSSRMAATLVLAGRAVSPSRFLFAGRRRGRRNRPQVTGDDHHMVASSAPGEPTSDGYGLAGDQAGDVEPGASVDDDTMTVNPFAALTALGENQQPGAAVSQHPGSSLHQADQMHNVQGRGHGRLSLAG